MIRGTDVPLIFSIAALTLGAVSLVWLAFFEFRLRRLFRGERAKNLEGLMREIVAELGENANKNEALDATLEHIEERLQQSAQHFGLVRFNPYSDGGGDQSFALAVLNEHKNGFVLSSLYHREGTRIYAKPILKSESTYALSSEEKEAIERSLNHS